MGRGVGAFANDITIVSLHPQPIRYWHLYARVASSATLRPFFTFPVTPRVIPTGIEYSAIGYDDGASVTAATTTFFTGATSGAVVSLSGTGFVTSKNYFPVTAGGAGYIGFTGFEL